MKLYISSSWSNREQVGILATSLLTAGFEVFDFTNQQHRKTSVICPPEKYQNTFDPDIQEYRDYIRRPEWYKVVDENKQMIQWSDVIILLLPCGNDAHSDWAYGVGLGKKSIVYGHPGRGSRSPVHLWADAFAVNFTEIEDILQYWKES